MADFISLLLHHFFIVIMIWLICSLAPFFYWNYDLACFFYFTIVLLDLLIGWFYLTSITPLFYINYDLSDLFYCTTVLLQLWFGWYLLFHHRLISFFIWLISSIPPMFLLQLWFSWFILLQHCFTEFMVWLISSIAPLFYWNFVLGDVS